ncbi:MAG: TonB-dependent receptor [Proteobacteria bacterium]|nr:TonB-dependent receptor [Pseudomonadota bacterium]
MFGSRIRIAAIAVAGAFPVSTHAAETATTSTELPPREVGQKAIVAQANSTPGAAATGLPISSPTTPEKIVVTASALREARIDLSPKVGTTVYTIDRGLIDGLGQGDATSFDEVLLRLPGVDKDSKASGSLHVRDDHGNVQYRINGVKLPENISGFGQSIDTRFVDRIDFLTGALPAQYGLRTAGIVEIQTKEGDAKPGGQIGVVVGSHNTVQPSAAFFGTKGALSYYLSGSFNSNSEGIENPLPNRNPMHDKTEQTKSFGDLSYIMDDQTRVALLFGTYNGKFQIPTNPGQPAGFTLAGFSDGTTGATSYPSAAVNEQQREVNRFFVVSFQKSLGDLNYQASVFHQYSNLHFYPDPIGDLVFNGVASDTLRSNSATGLQVDASKKLNADHTVRFGTEFTRQVTQSNNSVSLFGVDDTGAQTAPFIPFTIPYNSSKVGELFSVYLQDEWRIDPRLTLNYGARFDRVAAFTNEMQWSPRLNVAYKLSNDTALHAGYSRYFTPPPQELASQESINLYTGTTNQPQVPNSDNVKAERTHYFDAGLSHKLSPNLTVAADAYYKKIRNLIDEGQFGAALILSPFNYDKGYAKGLELSATYTDNHWTDYLNFAYQKAQGQNIVSGQSLFGPDELANIANHYIYLDHDQTFTVSGGLSYKFGQNHVSGDMIYGSGLRRTPDGGAPNSAALPAYSVFNMAFTHSWKTSATGTTEGRLAILNLFDKTYLLRDGTGVGVGAPQYGARRSLYVGISTTF